MCTGEEKTTLLSCGSTEEELLRKSFYTCLVVSIIACQLSFICGAAQGYSAILTPQLMYNQNTNSTIRINKYEASWIASLGTICRPLGALLEGITVEKIGRKSTMILTAILLACSWISTAMSRDVITIYVSRILISIGLGMVICVGLYIAEISLPKHRGTLLSMITPATMLGTLAVYALGSTFTWNVVAIMYGIYCCLTIVALCFVPESYIWYLFRNGRSKDKALRALLRLRNGDLSQTGLEITEAEVHNRRYEYGNDEISFYRRLFRNDPAVWKPFLILIGFSIVQQQAGYTVIVYYAVDFFSRFETSINGYTLSVAFAAISTVGSLILTSIVHVYNRKTLLAVSGLGMFTTMAGAAVFVTCESLKPYRLVPVILIFGYVFCCMLGMIDIPWMMVGELFPSDVRGSMSAMVTVFVFLITTGVIKIYPSLLDYLGQSGLLWYFSLFSLLAVAFSAVYFPETKDKSLFEIEDNLRQR